MTVDFDADGTLIRVRFYRPEGAPERRKDQLPIVVMAGGFFWVGKRTLGTMLR